MLKRLKDNFLRGIEKIKLFSSLFSERVKIEIAVIRLFFQSDEITKKKEELLKKIGQRVLEMKEHQDKNILKDIVISEAMTEIEKLEKDITDLKQKISDLSRVTGS